MIFNRQESSSNSAQQHEASHLLESQKIGKRIDVIAHNHRKFLRKYATASTVVDIPVLKLVEDQVFLESEQSNQLTFHSGDYIYSMPQEHSTSEIQLSRPHPFAAHYEPQTLLEDFEGTPLHGRTLAYCGIDKSVQEAPQLYMSSNAGLHCAGLFPGSKNITIDKHGMEVRYFGTVPFNFKLRYAGVHAKTKEAYLSPHMQSVTILESFGKAARERIIPITQLQEIIKFYHEGIPRLFAYACCNGLVEITIMDRDRNELFRYDAQGYVDANQVVDDFERFTTQSHTKGKEQIPKSHAVPPTLLSYRSQVVMQHMEPSDERTWLGQFNKTSDYLRKTNPVYFSKVDLVDEIVDGFPYLTKRERRLILEYSRLLAIVRLQLEHEVSDTEDSKNAYFDFDKELSNRFAAIRQQVLPLFKTFKRSRFRDADHINDVNLLFTTLEELVLMDNPTDNESVTF